MNLKSLQEQGDRANSDDLSYAIYSLEKQYSSLEKIDIELSTLGVPRDRKFAEEVDELVFRAKRLLSRLDLSERRLEAGERDRRSLDVSLCEGSILTGSVRLPQYDLPKFSGNVLQYQEWRDNFDVVVASQILPDHMKFSYLRQSLQGDAAKAIAGYTTTTDNYKAALDTIDRRYGKVDVLLAAHAQAINNVQPVYDASHVAGLRSLYDTYQANIRGMRQALERKYPDNAEVHKLVASPLIAPSIISRFPPELAVQWSREAPGGREYDLDALMSFLERECESREKFAYLNRGMGRPDPKEPRERPRRPTLANSAVEAESTQSGRTEAVNAIFEELETLPLDQRRSLVI